MSDDQGEGRSSEAKQGATRTLLGEAIDAHLAGRKAVMGQQVSLFDDADRLPDDELAGEPGPRGKGRPPGARNKATEAFRAFVRARHGDPMVKLMERAFADPKTLAAALHMDVGDVWQRQNEILLRLMPFLHSAMPAEVKVTAKGALAVAIASAPGALKAGDQVTALDPLSALLEMAQNQGLSFVGQGDANDALSNEKPVLVGEAKV